MVESRSAIFEATADPTRRHILMFLSDGERTATQIVGEVDSVGRTAVSSHLRVLRTAGLVNERREGRYRWYSLNRRAADELVQFLFNVYRSTFVELKQAAEKNVRDAGMELDGTSG